MPRHRFTKRRLFPDPRQADADGLLAYGGDLHPQRLLAAYAQGSFPWPGGADWPMLWYSPDPRMVLVPTDLHISRSLHKTLKKPLFEVRFDTAFAQVLRACATETLCVPRAGRDLVRARGQVPARGAHTVLAQELPELRIGVEERHGTSGRVRHRSDDPTRVHRMRRHPRVSNKPVTGLSVR